MGAEAWKRVEELFEAALRELPEHRDEFLQQACPDDPEVRREVLSLLNSSTIRKWSQTSSLRDSGTDRARGNGRRLSRT
jgi:hypothetical protein